MKILILTDGQGWICDRITAEMVKRIPFEFVIEDYTKISKEDFVIKANDVDLVHYQNWDIGNFLDVIDQIKTPIIVSIRSFRFPEYIHQLKGKVHFHIINPKQAEFFDGTYIPDGIFGEFKKDFVVGFAGRADDYKGYGLIKQACDELGVQFKPALTVPTSEMSSYYDSIDLYCCASLNEGHNTPVMECLARNKLVITTNVGIPAILGIDTIERSVEGIKQGILKHYTYLKVKDYTWENICKQLTKMYEDKFREWQSKN